MTPPALHRMSGITVTPFSCRMGSAEGSVGPLAPSATIRARTRPALRAVIWPSRAASTRTSTSRPKRVSLSKELSAGRVGHRSVGPEPPRQVTEIEAGRVVGAAAGVGDGNHPGAALVQQAGRRLADVAEALHRDRGASQIEADPAGGVADRVDDALARRIRPADGAADREGLPGDDAGHRVAPVHRHRVHDPGHHLGVGPHVRGGDVGFRADHRLDLGGEAAGQALQLLAAHRARIAGHAALRAAEGDLDQRALPGHPHGECADVIEIGLRVEAETALGRAAGHVVLDAVAREHADRAVVQLHGEVDRELALWDAQDGAQLLVQPEVLGGCVELGERRGEGVLPRGEGRAGPGCWGRAGRGCPAPRRRWVPRRCR